MLVVATFCSNMAQFRTIEASYYQRCCECVSGNLCLKPLYVKHAVLPPLQSTSVYCCRSFKCTVSTKSYASTPQGRFHQAEQKPDTTQNTSHARALALPRNHPRLPCKLKDATSINNWQDVAQRVELKRLASIEVTNDLIFKVNLCMFASLKMLDEALL